MNTMVILPSPPRHGNNDSSNGCSNINGKTNKRKKRGRASRRRRANARSIDEAVRALLRTTVDKDPTEDTFNQRPNEYNGKINDTKIDDFSGIIGDHLGKNNILFTLPGVWIRRQDARNGDRDPHSAIKCNWKCNLSSYFDPDPDAGIRSNFHINKEDDIMLTAQLGFVPGNGICVVTRVRDLQSIAMDKFPHLIRFLLQDPSWDQQNNSICHATGSIPWNASNHVRKQAADWQPIVLMQYPLALRTVTSCGKSRGRSSYCKHKVCGVHNDRGNPSGYGLVSLLDTETQSRTHQREDPVSDQHPKKSKGCSNHANVAMKIEPFPTLYWLTHPHMCMLISRLEADTHTNVRAMEQHLAEDKACIQTMKAAHASYSRRRWGLLTHDDLQEVVDVLKWEGALGPERGVAGIRRKTTIKCLHAHAAHYLASFGQQEEASEEEENVVGRWVVEAVEKMLKDVNTITEKCDETCTC